MRIRMFFLLFTCIMVSPSYSQKVWSLQDCINHALTHNIDIRQQVLNEKEGTYNLQQSKGNFLPTLNAEASHGYSFGRSVDPATNEFSTERTMRQSFNASSSFVLFAGFQNINYLRYTVLSNTALRYDTERSKNDLILTIAAAYMQILFSEDLVETTNQQIALIGQQLNRSQALYEGGTLPRGSVLELEARLAEEELNLITAQNNLNLAYLELIQLLDLNPEDPFNIERPQVEQVDEILLTDPSVVYQKAMNIQPSIKLAMTRIEMAQKQIALDRGRLSPSLLLNASLGTNYSEAGGVYLIPGGWVPLSYNDQIRENFNQYVGVSLRIPILNRWDVRTRINLSKVNLERARNAYELSSNNLNKAIYQAHADATAAWQKHQATIKSLDSFNESFNYTQQRFDLGMVSSVEFNESQTRLARAERDALQARYEFLFMMKIMEFYMGEGFVL